MPTARHLLRGIAPKASEEDLGHLMWNCTPFPFGRSKDPRKLRRNLRRYYRLGGHSVQGAVRYAGDELSREMDMHLARERGDARTPDDFPLPKPYPNALKPKDQVTRAFSRALLNAFRARNLSAFSARIKRMPDGLVHGSWVSALANAMMARPGRENYVRTVQWPMLDCLVKSGLPVEVDLFGGALLSRNYVLIEILIDQGSRPEKSQSLYNEARAQISQGAWPLPEMWCPDLFQAGNCEVFGASLLPTRSEYLPLIPAMQVEQVLCIHDALGVGREFIEMLSRRYAGIYDQKTVEMLDAPDYQALLGALVYLGWLDEGVIERHMLQNACADKKRYQLARAAASFQAQRFDSLCEPAPKSASISRL